MSEKIGGTKGTELENDYVEMEKVSTELIYIMAFVNFMFMVM